MRHDKQQQTTLILLSFVGVITGSFFMLTVVVVGGCILWDTALSIQVHGLRLELSIYQSIIIIIDEKIMFF